MKTKIVFAYIFAMYLLPMFSQTTSSTTRADSLSQVLLKRIEKLIAPIPLKALYYCDSVPISDNMMNKFSFVKNFSGWKEDRSNNSRLGYTKSLQSDRVTDATGTHWVNLNIFFYAKVSEQVTIYRIKPDMNFIDYSYLGEIPGKELAPILIMTLKKISEKNIVRYDEVIFHSTFKQYQEYYDSLDPYTLYTEHYKYVDNKWIEIKDN